MSKIEGKKKKLMMIEIYPPRKMCSARIKEPIMATMIIMRGLNAVAKTGPFFLITNP